MPEHPAPTVSIAAAYIRVSTEDQVEYSPDSQLKKIQEYAKQHNMIVPDDYIFIDPAISGRYAKKRPAFLKMIAIAKESPRPFDTILVWKFSRFARNQEESIVFKSMLQKANGIDVVSVSEPIPDDVFGSLIERIIEWMDAFYSIRLSGEVKRGMAEKVSRGEPVSIAPLGYTMVNKELIPNDKADAIRDIFRSYLAGDGMRRIAQRLGESGVRTVRGNWPDNRLIEYILNNPVYIGKIRWSTEGRAASLRKYDAPNIVITDGHHVPLIDQATWDAVQLRLSEQKRQYTPRMRTEQEIEFMLKGLCHCSACGATLCACGRQDSNLQCNKYARGQCRVSHSIAIHIAEELVTQAISNALATGSFPMDAPKPSTRSNSTDYTRLIRAEERKLVRIKEAYLAGVDTVEEYRANKTAIQQNIAALKSREQSENPTVPFDLVAYRAKVSAVLTTITSDSAPSIKNAALRTILTRIIFNRSSRTFDLFFRP